MGNTPLIRLERWNDISSDVSVHVKDESANPISHTHKDRRSTLIVQEAIARGVDTLALITAGNAGYSLATLAQGTRLKVVSIVKPTLAPSIRTALQAAGAEVKDIDLSQKVESGEVIELARSRTDEMIWDVSNGFVEAYTAVLDEMTDDIPDTIVTPVGSGELFLGLHLGIETRKLPTRLVGVGVTSPQSKADKLYATWTPSHNAIEEIATGQHELIQLTEEEVQWCIEHAPEGLAAEPSALVVFGALRRIRDRVRNVVLINTGSGLRE